MKETINSQDYTILCISVIDMIDIRVLNKILNTPDKQITITYKKYSIKKLFLLFIRNHA